MPSEASEFPMTSAVASPSASFHRHAVLAWVGDVVRGSGRISAGSGSFSTSATFPQVSGEPRGATTPEELLAASHAVSFGIALRTALAQRGATARELRVSAIVTADEDGAEIRVWSAHLDAVVVGLSGLGEPALDDAGRDAESACAISALLRPTVAVSVQVRAVNR
jgi:osmotically inducible protein OsmC